MLGKQKLKHNNNIKQIILSQVKWNLRRKEVKNIEDPRNKVGFLLLNSPWGCVWEVRDFASPSSIGPAHSISFCNMLFAPKHFMPKHSVQSRVSLTLSGGGCATFSILLSLSSSCRFLACGPDVNPPSTSSQPHPLLVWEACNNGVFSRLAGAKRTADKLIRSIFIQVHISFILARTHWITTSKWIYITATRYKQVQWFLIEQLSYQNVKPYIWYEHFVWIFCNQLWSFRVLVTSRSTTLCRWNKSWTIRRKICAGKG